MCKIRDKEIERQVIGTARLDCGAGCTVSFRLFCLFQHGPTAANPRLQVCCCGSGGLEITIDCCTAGDQQQQRVA